ncbi:MAG: hypothetical protein P4L79_09800 [Legionella sp.]|uniref:beta strand repeat-containing protein n=1 Tax=Legionella sp. TaxID=459 RepID=UPI00283BE356|nr:hypothetical protein [Legionella sp.]
MSNTLLQIYRSNTVSAPTSLLGGQLAYTSNGNVLYIGDPAGGGVTPIGGKYFPGTLTANQALVANSTSGIDKIITGNVTTTYLIANGSNGLGGNVLTSNATGGIYWAALTSGVAGLTTQVQYNNGGTLTGNASFTFTQSSNTLYVSNALSVNSIYVNGSNGQGTGNVLTSNSTGGLSWAPAGGVVGTTTQVAFNNGGVMTGNAALTFTLATNTLSVVNSIAIGAASLNATNYSATSNNALYLGGTLAANFVQNTDSRTLSGNLTFTGTNTVFSSNVTTQANTTIGGANLYVTSTNTTFTGIVNHSGNVAFTGTNTYITGTNTTITSNVTFTGANIQATSATLNLLNMNVSGNLTVSGGVTTINTTQLSVADATIQTADGNLTTDVVDTGIYAPGGNATTTWYSVIGRIAASSNSTNPYFAMFTTKTNPNTASTFDISAANVSYGTLRTYLAPYGTGGAFIANSSVINITANSTVSAAIAANTLSLTTALLATSGGTGILGSAFAAGDITYAATGAPTALTRLNISANGSVLQVLNNLPAWGGLDGGTF